jgi:hypothetical protein
VSNQKKIEKLRGKVGREKIEGITSSDPKIVKSDPEATRRVQ